MVDEIHVPRHLMEFTLRYIEENSTLMWGSGLRPTQRIKDFEGHGHIAEYISLVRLCGDLGYSIYTGYSNTFNDLEEFIEGYEKKDTRKRQWKLLR